MCPPVSYILNFYITIVQLFISHREHFFISRMYFIYFFITCITRKFNFYYPSEYMRSFAIFSTKARKLFDNETELTIYVHYFFHSSHNINDYSCK